MNLVEVIQGQLTNQVTGKLASLIGGSEENTQSAVGAAVPGLLSALSSVAMGGGKGASQLTDAVSGFDLGTVSKLAGMLSDSPDTIQSKGNGFLSSILSNTVLSGLSSSIAKFSGLNQGIVSKLLGYLSPLVIGAVANQFKGKQVTPQGLSSMFADQKKNIAGALPGGFSLGDIPGLSGIESAAERTTQAAQDSGASLIKTLLPLALLGLLALVAWFAWKNLSAKPDVVVEPEVVTTPDLTLRTDAIPPVLNQTTLRESYVEATDAIKGITDLASAEAALPKLNELNGKLNGLVALWDKLPEGVQSTLSGITRENLGGLESIIKPVLDIPGVGSLLGPVLKEIVGKLTAIGGAA